MAMPQCCYLAKGAKRPSHTTNMLTSSKNQVPYILAVTAPNEESPNRLYRLALNFVYSIELFSILLVIRDKICQKWDEICQKWDEICLKWDEICVGRNLSKMGRNLLKMGRNLFGTKSVKIRRGTKSVWDEICHIH